MLLAGTPVSWFEFAAGTTLQLRQRVASESKHASDQCQCAAVSPTVNKSCSFLSLVSLFLPTANSQYICLRIAIFRLVDNLMPSRLQIVHGLCYKLKPWHWNFCRKLTLHIFLLQYNVLYLFECVLFCIFFVCSVNFLYIYFFTHN